MTPRTRKLQLAQRQQQLLLRSAELRVSLGQQTRVLQTPLALADQVRAGLQWLREHPLLPVMALLLVAFKRPQRALLWASRFGIGLDIYKKVRGWLFKPAAPAADAAATTATAATAKDQP